jgi:hydrogenase expression/formation protein HypE
MQVSILRVSPGKLSRSFFDATIYPNLGSLRNEVLVGPGVGVDTCVVKIASNEVLVATTDPISLIPELGSRDSAWLSVNLIASDLVTSGFRPQYAIFDLNLPAGIEDSELDVYWRSISDECQNLGISIIGGHSARFEGLNSTVIGSGTMMSIGSSNSYLTSRDALLGDRLILTKSAAIATTGILSRVFPETVKSRVGATVAEAAQSYFKKMSVVNEALKAVSAGIRSDGVSAIHDVTEGGVLSAVYELALASSLGARVELAAIPISLETKEICGIFGIDPLTSLGEGSLILACNPSKSAEIISLVMSLGVEATEIGVLVAQDKGIMTRDLSGAETPINYPVQDPYWQAYYVGKKRKLT